MHARSRLLAAVLLVLILFTGMIPVRAEISEADHPSAGAILPGSATRVRMLSQSVRMDVQSSGLVRVGASYQLTGQGGEGEILDVYLPLNFTMAAPPSGAGATCTVFEPNPPGSITNLSVRVNGIEPLLRFLYSQEESGGIEHGIPCWAVFSAAFPPGQEVSVELSYTARSVGYLLRPGAGWDGTIASSDVTVRFPYLLNDLNFRGCSAGPAGRNQGSGCQVSGQEVRWQVDDLEPVFDLVFDIIPAAVWNKVALELENTRANPGDGDAWGRLGLAYKNLIKRVDPAHVYLDEQGRANPQTWLKLDEPGALVIFQASAAAYQNAVELKPLNADWHYGYAELLCLKVRGESSAARSTDLVGCAEQLKLTLENSPDTRHRDARRMLSFLPPEVVDRSGPQPVYLILTPPPPTVTPAASPTPSASPTPTFTVTPLPPTTTPGRTASPSPSTAATVQAVLTGTPQAGGSPPAQQVAIPAGLGACSAGLVTGAAGLLLFLRGRSRRAC